MIHFLYKLNYITNIGGVTPRTEEQVDLGLAVVDGLYLGRINAETDATGYLLSIAEHAPVVISAQEAAGFPLVHVTEIREGNPGEETTRALTAEETAAKNAAIALLAKLGVRTAISINVGDLSDLVSDLSKRLALVDRIVLALFDVVENAGEMPADIKAVADKYKADHTAKLITDAIDINGKTLMQNYEILRDRNNAISNILTSYYGA